MPPVWKRKPTAKAAANPARTTTRKAPATATARSTRQTNRQASDSPPDRQNIDALAPSTIQSLEELIHGLTANATEAQDAIEDLRTRFDRYDRDVHTINDKIDALTQAVTSQTPARRVPAGSLPSTPRRNGNDPRSFIQNHLPWIDSSLLTNLVSLKLDVKDLVRLLPVEDRPKGRSSALPHSVSVDLQTGKWTSNEDAPVSFDKDIPDFQTLMYILSTYGALRSLYDAEDLGIGTAIFLYIKQLSRWVLVDKFHFPYVRSYFIAHFRKYQASTNPLDWVDTDIQLFTAHIRPTAPVPPVSTARSTTSRKSQKENTICNNWNTEGKGCTWNTCTRAHHCANCGSNEHPAYRCKGTVKKEGPKP